MGPGAGSPRAGRARSPDSPARSRPIGSRRPRPTRSCAGSWPSPASAPGPPASICGQGLGRPDAAPAGDLGLIKLCSALLRRRADAADTERLLSQYAPWQGFAAAHLLSHPLAHGQAYRGYLAA